jgi:hypothetical protein
MPARANLANLRPCGCAAIRPKHPRVHASTSPDSPPLHCPETIVAIEGSYSPNMQATATQAQTQPPATNPDLEQPQRLFQCSTCKRSFTRADHLTRHVRARTCSNSALGAQGELVKSSSIRLSSHKCRANCELSYFDSLYMDTRIVFSCSD